MKYLFALLFLFNVAKAQWSNTLPVLGLNVDFDNSGNVYVLGNPCSPPLDTLYKFNSSGTLLWQYPISPNEFYYGNFVVDKNTQDVYVSTGSGYNMIEEVSSQGTYKSAIVKANGVGWRIAMNCLDSLVVTPDEIFGQDLISVNTSLTSEADYGIFYCNINKSGNNHDISLLALDNTHYIYALFAKTTFSKDVTNWNNELIKMDLSNPCQTVWATKTNYTFQEVSSIKLGCQGVFQNGFNGMAIDNINNYVYLYDGSVLSQYSTSGTLLHSASLGSTPFIFSGIDVDNQGYIYIGYYYSVLQYKSTSSGLVSNGVYCLTPDTVYDVKVGNNMLYISGRYFVQTCILNSQSQCYTSPLPISFVDFTAKVDGSIVNFKWKTESEVNNDSFIIYNSLDNIHFHPITAMRGSGNINYPKEYRTYVNEAKIGQIYYLLTSKDYDGKTYKYKTVSVFIKPEEIELPKYDLLGRQLR